MIDESMAEHLEDPMNIYMVISHHWLLLGTVQVTYSIECRGMLQLWDFGLITITGRLETLQLFLTGILEFPQSIIREQ